MIDVVFLLLVFFMLASKFTTERSLTLKGGGDGAGSSWDGAPRLLTLSPDRMAFNGTPVALSGLAAMLRQSGIRSDQAILLRIEGETDVQRLTDALDALSEAGFTSPVLLP